MGFDNRVHPVCHSIMEASVTVDTAGRVVIPKNLRDQMQIRPGDRLSLMSEGETVVLRPIRSAAPLQLEQGVWVYRTGRTLTAETTNATLREIRDERDAMSFEAAG